MRWFEAGSSGIECELPTTAIGLLQNEAEMPRVPAYDLRPFLKEIPRWRTQSFTERSFGALQGPSMLDAFVLGYNSIHLSPGVKEALNARPPLGHLVILHQLRQDSLAFLRDRLAIGLEPIPRGHTSTAVVREGRPRVDEPLLNWPRRVGAIDAAAVCSLLVKPESAWEVVLELPGHERGLPVLVRTSQLISQRIVVCTLLLHNDREKHPSHHALLENLITYAATGTPRIAVVEPPEPEATCGEGEGARLTERLRVQGAEVVRVRATGGGDPLHAWPLLGAERIVLPESTPDAILGDNTETWLEGGRGRTLVHAGAQKVTVEARATDVEWVARRWALWFGTTAGERWWGSVFAMRAVLRVLDALPRVLGGEALGRLGLRLEPDAYAGHVANLLRPRVRRGNVDATVAATAAALDLYHLTGKRGLNHWEAQSIRNWLEGSFADASFEERLDIARSLRAPKLVGRALAEDDAASRPLSLVAATRLREALVACATQEPETIPGTLPLDLDAEAIKDLRERPLLAAEFVAAASICAEAESLQDLSVLTGEVRAAALQGLTSLRGLADDMEAVPPDPYAVCTDALAQLSWLHAERGLNAFQIRPEARDVPTSAVQSLLSEALRAREQEAKLQDAVAPLGRAVQFLAALSLTGAAFAVVAVFRLFGVEIGRTAALVALGGVVVTLGALELVHRRLLRPPQPATPPDVRLAQHVLGVVALMLAAAGVVAAVRLGGSVVGAVPMVALAAGAAVMMVWLLTRANLAPPWLEVVAGWLVTPPAFAEWAQRLLVPPPKRPPRPDAEEPPDESMGPGDPHREP